jgi:D-3-phosphoglycerate dehydrogenase
VQDNREIRQAFFQKIQSENNFFTTKNCAPISDKGKSIMKRKIWSLSPSFGHVIKSPIIFLEENGFVVDLLVKNIKLRMEDALLTIPEYDALVPGLFSITAELMDAAPNLKIIAMAGAGVDHIDVAAATKRGILVTNVPGTNNQAVAELAIGFVFALSRNIASADKEVKAGSWPRITGQEVKGKTLGIVGMGQIGKEVAKMALSLGMKVLAFDAFPDHEFAKRYKVKFFHLQELMPLADYVSVHVPLLKETTGLINEKMLRSMKPTAYLINLSRGRVVEESALYKVLKEKTIAGAALDVFAEEPPINSPLLSLSNAVTTPHMGGYTFEALQQIGMGCARNIADYFDGITPENVVNKEVLLR